MTLRKIGLILTTALLLLSGSGCALFQFKKQHRKHRQQLQKFKKPLMHFSWRKPAVS